MVSEKEIEQIIVDFRPFTHNSEIAEAAQKIMKLFGDTVETQRLQIVSQEKGADVLREKIKSAESQRETDRQQRQELRRTIEEQIKEIARLEHQYGEMKVLKDSLQGDKRSLLEQRTELCDEIDKTTKRIGQLAAEIRQLKVTIANLESGIPQAVQAHIMGTLEEGVKGVGGCWPDWVYAARRAIAYCRHAGYDPFKQPPLDEQVKRAIEEEKIIGEIPLTGRRVNEPERHGPIHYAPYGKNAIGQFDCGAADGGYTETSSVVTCSACKKLSPGLWPNTYSASAEPGTGRVPSWEELGCYRCMLCAGVHKAGQSCPKAQDEPQPWVLGYRSEQDQAARISDDPGFQALKDDKDVWDAEHAAELVLADLEEPAIDVGLVQFQFQDGGVLSFADMANPALAKLFKDHPEMIPKGFYIKND